MDNNGKLILEGIFALFVCCGLSVALGMGQFFAYVLLALYIAIRVAITVFIRQKNGGKKKDGKNRTGLTIAAACLIVVAIILWVFVSGTSSDGSSTGRKCTICKKPATHTFQGSGYCDKHYNNAVSWAIDNVAGK